MTERRVFTENSFVQSRHKGSYYSLTMFYSKLLPALCAPLFCLMVVGTAQEVSYVLEPFEGPQATPTFHSVNYSFEFNDVLFGQGALRVTNQTSQSGYLTWMIDPTTEPTHSCIGANAVSVWFKLVSGRSTIMRLVVLEQEGDVGLESVASEQQRLAPSGEWQELRLNVDTSFDKVPNLDHIAGFRLELSNIGEVLIDHLACWGEDLLGAAIRTHDTFDETLESTRWKPNYFQSPTSANETSVTLQNGEMNIDYLVQQTENWGGYIAFRHFAPGNAYYNLSSATELSFDYSVAKNASDSGRLHLRFILLDGHGCELNCRDEKSLEVYYSFYFVLDEQSAGRTASRYLWGDDDVNSPFYRPGWTGVADNHILDTSSIKGFIIELSLDSQGGILSTVSGSISIGNIQTRIGGSRVGGSNSTGACVVENGVMFGADSFQKREFLDDEKCCNACSIDPECLFSFTDGRDCYLSSSLESVGIPTTAHELGRVSTWQDDEVKRGDFCSVCECRESDNTIDCHGRDLVVLPKAFVVEGWVPRRLDLTENQRLIFIGSTALDSISSSLEEIILPKQIQYLSEQSVAGMSKLVSIRFDDEDINAHNLQNAITSPDGFFGDICCSPALSTKLIGLDPNKSLSFCDMQADRVGADAVYLPFVQYFEAELFLTLRPSSEFMAEAAESPEKCAEYCQIQSGCNYFSYDARYHEAEHSCYLAVNEGIRSDYVCCAPASFADLNQTSPGWTSGYPARTRQVVDNAKVVVSRSETVASASNDFTVTYNLWLGAMPQRGAVWVEPTVLVTTDLEYEIVPSRVALYDNETVARVRILVRNPSEVGGTSLIITNSIQSCDAAFLPLDTDEYSVLISVHYPTNGLGLVATGIIAGLVALLLASLLSIYLLNIKKKRQADTIWKINASELTFEDPPKSIGQGTFGLVLLAEYRGTQVAVKQLNFSTPRNPTVMQNTDDIECASISHETRAGSSIASIVSCKNFAEEMRFLSKLRHPNIATLMGAVVEKNAARMIVMEFAMNGSLFDFIRNETIVMEGELILPILRDISQGMRFLHSFSPPVIHGNLKSANVLIDSRFHAKVADFGLCRGRNQKATGTPYWMAPELLRGGTTNTSSSDVYSFGIILYELYARQEPYAGDNPMKIFQVLMDNAVNKRPPAPKSCPPAIRVIMNECVVGNAELRPTFEEIDLHLKRLDVTTVEPLGSVSKKNASTDVLYDMFPKSVAEALRDGRKVEPESRDCVTVLFSDIVGFTDISSKMAPIEVSNLLDRLYQKFDELSRVHDVFKVETIGDAYVSIANLTKDQPDHVVRIATFAVDCVRAASETLIDENNPDLGFVSIRCGFDVGPVVANVVGSRNPRYCLFGDVVNCSARMEQTSLKNRVQMSESAAVLLGRHQHSLDIRPRGMINVKGKGNMRTHWVWPSDRTNYPHDEAELLVRAVNPYGDSNECRPSLLSYNSVARLGLKLGR